jgi:hypothetical protein
MYITYTGPDVVGLACCFTNRPNRVSKVTYPKTEAAWFSTSSYADPTAPWAGGLEPGLWQCWKRFSRGTGNLQLEFVSVQDNSPYRPRGTENRTPIRVLQYLQPCGFPRRRYRLHDGNFGAVTSDYGPRTMELGGKIVF